MKRVIQLVALILIGTWALPQIQAQCLPDTANCKDVGDPGQICPRNLPDAFLNEPYDEVITVIAPDTASLGNLQIAIQYIEVDSVVNLPPGIAYAANAEKFYADSAYCIQISGSPSEAGEFPLTIYVTPYIKYLTTIIKGGQIKDSTSVVMTVQSASGMDPQRLNTFTVLPNAPNPFQEATQLGYFSPSPDQVSLQVYSILGKLVHEEELRTAPGKHYFHFSGRELMPGTYIYRVRHGAGISSGKFIKSGK